MKQTKSNVFLFGIIVFGVLAIKLIAIASNIYNAPVANGVDHDFLDLQHHLFGLLIVVGIGLSGLLVPAILSRKARVGSENRK